MTVYNVTTMLGCNVGFEILTRRDFKSIEHEALWSVMVNLFAIRITITRYPEDD